MQPSLSATILVADDDSAVRDVTARILRRLGYTVLVADGGADAIRLISTHPGQVDLLFTDVMMPEMSGPELALLLRQRHSGLRVIFCSGYIDDASVRVNVGNGRSHFLGKPFTIEQISTKVAQALAEPLDDSPGPA
jgi:two-component system cell cycle sensor histidine kinase/response regulator CckA